MSRLCITELLYHHLKSSWPVKLVRKTRKKSAAQYNSLNYYILFHCVSQTLYWIFGKIWIFRSLKVKVSEKESKILFKIRISVLITGARLLFYFFGVRTRGITRHVIHIGQLEMFSTLAVRLTKGAISKSNSMCLLSEFCLLAFDAFPEKLLFLCFWLLYLKLCQHLLTTREGLQEQWQLTHFMLLVIVAYRNIDGFVKA